MRCIVVEDEPVVAVGIRAMVQDAGHEVADVAHSGEEALALAAESRPDLAIVDIKLPGMDGLDTASRLISDFRVPAIVLTGFADEEFVGRATAAGVFAYLLKPVSKELLCANMQLAAARAVEMAGLRKEADDVRAALEVRKLSERAKHVLMERLSLNETDAFAHMRQKCRNQNKTMRQVSDQILNAEQSFLAEVDKDPPRRRPEHEEDAS